MALLDEPVCPDCEAEILYLGVEHGFECLCPSDEEDDGC